jgi:predicted RecA/RadA family phage recombinase
MTTTPKYPVGTPIPLAITTTRTSGVPFLQGTMAVVPVTDGVNGDTIAVEIDGIHSAVPKVTGSAWTVGQALYWDVVADKFTHTANSGANPRVATAMEPAASGDTTGVVKLGQF